MFLNQYQDLMAEPISEQNYRNWVQKWRRVRLCFETLKYDAEFRKMGIVLERRELKLMKSEGKNDIPKDFLVIDNGPVDEKLLRVYQSDSQSITNALHELHDLRTYGKILYHTRFNKEEADQIHTSLLEKLEKEKEERKKARIARTPSPEERERLRAEKRAQWHSANPK